MTVTVGSDSYITEQEFSDFAALRGITVTGDLTSMLIRAMDYLEQQLFKGVKTSGLQVLEFPRSGVYIGGVLVDSATVPKDIKNAQAVVAIDVFNGQNPNAMIDRAVKRESLDSLQVEYMDNAGATPVNPWLNGLLNKYLSSGGGSAFNIAVVR